MTPFTALMGVINTLKIIFCGVFYLYNFHTWSHTTPESRLDVFEGIMFSWGSKINYVHISLTNL